MNFFFLSLSLFLSFCLRSREEWGVFSAVRAVPARFRRGPGAVPARFQRGFSPVSLRPGVRVPVAAGCC